MNANDKVYIGTSGWHYKHWKGPFYPEKMDESEFLDYYAERLHTVEINNSFYNLPEAKTLRQWCDTVPKKFIFAVKASRYVTHMKKLKDPKKSLSTLLKRLKSLGDKKGPILFQFPPKWDVNVERLKSFLDALPDENRYIFEFRDLSWFEQEVYETLAEHEAAFCIYELAGTVSPLKLTAYFIYIRLHGPGDAYEGSYSKKTLKDQAGNIAKWTQDGKTVYCYFDNDQSGYAAKNSLTLQEIIDK